MRVLVVDDDPELGELVSRSLVREGHVVDVAGSLAGARGALREEFDLLALDLGLPDGSGLDLCRELRQRDSPLPILLLTGQSAVGQRVAGLDAGADDYLVKPFAVAELRARVRALGRRRAKSLATFYRQGDVELDLGGRRARREGIEVELTPREWAVVEALAAARGRVLSRHRLLEEAWGESTESAAASLEVLIGRVRRKLGRSFVRTARGLGYALD